MRLLSSLCLAMSMLIIPQCIQAQAPHPQQQNTQTIGTEVLNSAKVRPSPTTTPTKELLKKMSGHPSKRIDGMPLETPEEAMKKHGEKPAPAKKGP